MKWLLAIVLLGAVPRLGLALYLGDTVTSLPPAADQMWYHEIALNVVAGKGYVFTHLPAQWFLPGEPTAYYSYLYTTFLAAVYAVFGPHAVAARIIQALLCSLMPLQVYGLTKRILAQGARRTAQEGSSPAAILQETGEAVPLVAAAITAFYAYFIFFSSTLMTEALYLPAVVWSLDLTFRLAERPTPGRWIAWGAAAAVATLARQVYMPMAGLLFLWVLWKARRQVKIGHVALGAAAAAALILPWTVHNYLVFDRFLLLNSNAGVILWTSNRPEIGTQFAVEAWHSVPPDLEGAGEVELSNELMRRGAAVIAADPKRIAILSFNRLVEFFRFWPMEGSTALNNLARTASFTVCLPFMAAGLVLSLREWRRWLILYLFIVVYTLVHVITWAGIRYRLPVDVVLMPFAALAVVGIAERLRRTGKVHP
jgi:4-amino-4-deoxy-L-arabinose transferase-like glycosyltransferase